MSECPSEYAPLVVQDFLLLEGEGIWFGLFWGEATLCGATSPCSAGGLASVGLDLVDPFGDTKVSLLDDKLVCGLSVGAVSFDFWEAVGIVC